MKRRVLLIGLVFLFTFQGNGQKISLKFNADKKFKIIQITDLHYISGDPRSANVLKDIGAIVDAEKPDLVFFTGDLIFGKPADQSMVEIIETISKRKVPFAVTFGNHDDQYGLDRFELLKIIQKYPYNVTSTTKEIFGVTNYCLPILSSFTDKIVEVLYSFDSNTVSTISGIDGYGYIHFDQIAWYRKMSQAFTRQNDGIPIPSLAFFHIPLPEYKEATRDDEHGRMVGVREEGICCPKINSGLFVSMKEMGDIQAVFVGHDHDNDFAAYWNRMFFIYGRFSGGNTVYNNLKPNGARVIEITEGKNGFRSWIHLRDGKIIQDMQYPDSFKQ